VQGGLIPPGNWGYADCADIHYKFDVAKAKQMLQAAGLAAPVTLKFICGADPSDRSATAQLVKGFLEDAGFKINLDIIDRTQALNTATDAKTPYHLYSTGIPAPVDPGGTLTSYLTKDGFYNTGKSSTDPLQAQIDQLVAAGGSTYVQEERKKSYLQAQRISIQNVISVQPLVYNVVYGGVRSNLKGAETLWMPPGTSWRLTGLWLA
jgi:ABC-type transport system substrate-binding protein